VLLLILLLHGAQQHASNFLVGRVLGGESPFSVAHGVIALFAVNHRLHAGAVLLERSKVQRVLLLLVGNVAVDRFDAQECLDALDVPTTSRTRDGGVAQVTSVVDVARVAAQ